MATLQQSIENPDWRLVVEVDPNVGGDGQRIRVEGDTHSFRTLAAMLLAMAETVDDPCHPSSGTGWHLAMNPKDIAQLTLKNASYLTLNCSPKAP